jgi:phenylacetate-coenzyme A ligase PaaK-like adenylate-forming protein
MQLSISSIGEAGAFRRLQICNIWLREAAPRLVHNFAETYLPEHVHFVEALSFYMLDIRQLFIYRYRSRGEVCIDCSFAHVHWVVVQIAFAIMTGNHTVMFMTEELHAKLKSQLQVLESCLRVSTHGPLPFDPGLSFDFSYDASNDVLFNELITEDNSAFFLESTNPSISNLLIREVKEWTHLRVLYGDVVSMPMDEFDLLSDDRRAVFVRERAQYVAQEIRQLCPFYHNLELSPDKSLSFTTSPSATAPCLLDGAALSTHVPPYGSDLISQQATMPHQHSSPHSPPVSLCIYDVAFASGGTSGQMKFVYRSTREDQENARYLAKGLHAQGLGRSDRVMNFLSSGLWGGMHVFGLALGYVGCGVLPTGPGFPDEDTLRLMVQLRPTAILGTPSYVLKLADCLERLRNDRSAGSSLSSVTGVDPCLASVCTVITGGEQLFSGMQLKIQKAFGVGRFLSTGYTSNETGAIAFRCAHLPPTYFHIHENMQNIEIVLRDGDSVREEMTGRIVTSNLNRLLMPVIGYDIGDSGRLPREVPHEAESPIATEYGVCRCGRRLRVLQLLGRWDDRVRVGAQDLYADHVAAAVEAVEGLSLNFSIHIFRSEVSCRDVVEIQVESIEKKEDTNSDGHSSLEVSLLTQLAKHTRLDWVQSTPNIGSGSDDVSLGSVNDSRDVKISTQGTGAAEVRSEIGDSSGWVAEGLIEVPVVTILDPGCLPRNSRTGKIKRIVDHRLI